MKKLKKTYLLPLLINVSILMKGEGTVTSFTSIHHVECNIILISRLIVGMKIVYFFKPSLFPSFASAQQSWLILILLLPPSPSACRGDGLHRRLGLGFDKCCPEVCDWRKPHAKDHLDQVQKEPPASLSGAGVTNCLMCLVMVTFPVTFRVIMPIILWGFEQSEGQLRWTVRSKGPKKVKNVSPWRQCFDCFLHCWFDTLHLSLSSVKKDNTQWTHCPRSVTGWIKN